MVKDSRKNLEIQKQKLAKLEEDVANNKDPFAGMPDQYRLDISEAHWTR